MQVAAKSPHSVSCGGIVSGFSHLRTKQELFHRNLISDQAPAARRRIASASPGTAGDPRAYLPNLSAGRKDPAARSAQRGPDMSEDDLGGSPWGLRWKQS